MGGVSSKDNALPTTSSSTRSATQIKGSPYGYVAQGFRGSHPSPNSSTTDRIDFSNDTATTTTTGNQTQSAHYSKGVGNNNYGYMLSGTPSGNSVVSRIDYSNDSAACAPKGPLAYGAWEAGATGNASYGYHGGGFNQAASARTSKIQRLDYSSDTSTAVEKGPLAANHYRTAATGNLSYGYWGGGNIVPSPSISSFVSRLDYSSDTTTAVEKGPLANPWREGGAVGNTSYGYWAGNDPVPSNASTLQRLEWANDTVAASTKGNLTANKKQVTATGSDSFGYFSGGLAPWPDRISTIDRVDYSNDTATASPKGPLSAIGYGMASVSSQENALGAETVYPWYDISGRGNNANITDSRFRATDGGYFSFDGTGDFLTVPSTNAFAFGTGDFSVEYWVKTASGIATANIINPDSESGSGYWAHQYDTTFDWNSVYDAPAGPAYGYFGGGSNGSTNKSSVDRIDYASDTPTAATKGPLDATRYALAATGNGLYGYFAGGRNQGTKVDRFDYSNDTAEALDKGSLNTGRYRHGAVGNNSYGYFGGGNSPSYSTQSTIDRVDFSNDTATAAEKGPLSSSTFNIIDGTGNSNFGYLAPGGNSIVHRIDYSNDTATAGEKGPLSRNAAKVGATGNASFGYFAGGAPGSDEKTTVDRLDYSSDTTTASVKGPLAAARYWCPSTGSSSFGYIAGGAWPAVSNVDRIDYSNDTATAAVKGPLTITKYGHGSASAQANALPAGSTELYTCSLSPVNDGEWHNVVMTRVGGTQQTYYDGVGINTASGTYTDSNNYSGVDGWFIGKGSQPGGTAFSGDLANITIRKGKGLSSDEVQQNFNALKSRFGV